MAMRRGASAAGKGFLLGAAFWIGMSLGCIQSESEPDIEVAEPDIQTAGSGTELGNVMGVLVGPDRKPAAGVEVKLNAIGKGPSQGPSLTTTTDSSGAFAFKVETGVFRLWTLDGAGNGATVDSLHPSPVDTINLRELSLAPLGGIKGYVKSYPAGSYLQLIGTPFYSRFDGDTEFVWEGIPAGTYWLDVRLTGWMTAMPNSLRIPVSVAPGTVTEMSDTIHASAIDLELNSLELPYDLSDKIVPVDMKRIDSTFWMLNGVRIENVGPPGIRVEIILAESMLDSSRTNRLQLFVHSGDSLYMVRVWNITWNRGRPVRLAYQAVRAEILAMEPDTRPEARPLGSAEGNTLGTFRVLDSRRLAPEELEYWEWPAEAGGDSTVSGAFKASVHKTNASWVRGCKVAGQGPPPQNLPGDTVTFFLLPDSILGAVAFRVRTDERFQDMDRLGYLARSDWPLGLAFDKFVKENELRISLRPEGLQLEWPMLLGFLESARPCQSPFRRFLVDSSGRVREKIATPAGIDPARLLLLYRAEFSDLIDADSLPASGAYAFIDSAGSVVAGSQDSIRRSALDAGALAELKTLLSDLPKPIPADWHREYFINRWQTGPKTSLRYLVGDQVGALHFVDHPEAAPAKADLFSRVERWLRDRNLL